MWRPRCPPTLSLIERQPANQEIKMSSNPKRLLLSIAAAATLAAGPAAALASAYDCGYPTSVVSR